MFHVKLSQIPGGVAGVGAKRSPQPVSNGCDLSDVSANTGQPPGTCSPVMRVLDVRTFGARADTTQRHDFGSRHHTQGPLRFDPSHPPSQGRLQEAVKT